MSFLQSPFRPSDDSHLLPFPIGANALASVGLADLSRIVGNSVCSIVLFSSFILSLFLLDFPLLQRGIGEASDDLVQANARRHLPVGRHQTSSLWQYVRL